MGERKDRSPPHDLGTETKSSSQARGAKELAGTREHTFLIPMAMPNFVQHLKGHWLKEFPQQCHEAFIHVFIEYHVPVR